METLHETGKEPETKGTMQQTYKTTVATAEDQGVQAVTTGNVKRIEYSQDEAGKHYVEKNEPISSKQIMSEKEMLALTDKEEGVVEETVEKLKQVRRRKPDGTQEDFPELEERTTETKRTAMSDVKGYPEPDEEVEQEVAPKKVPKEEDTPRPQAPKRNDTI